MKKKGIDMKRIALHLVFALILCPFLGATVAYSATADEMAEKAKGKYAEGSFKDAFDLLAMASSAHSGSAEGKKRIAQAYTDIGVKEFDSRNFKNAYECFKTAVKLNPTDQLASQYFWRMKKEFDVTGLKNEGAEEQAESAVPQPPGKTAKTPPAPFQETAPDSETLEKIRKTEQELVALRQSAASAKNENALLRSELELQKKSSERELQAVRETAAAAKSENALQRSENAAVRLEIDQQKKRSEQELAAIRESAFSAKNENSLLRGELELQNKASERELQDVKESSEAAKSENSAVRAELEQQKRIMDQLRDNVAKSGRTAGQENRSFADLVASYKNLIDRERQAREVETGVIAEELKEHKRLLEEQKSANINLILAAAGGFILLAVLLFLLFFLIARSRMRKLLERQRSAFAFSRYGAPAPAIGNLQRFIPQYTPESFLIDVNPTPSPGSEEGKDKNGQNTLFRDLLRAERLKKMYDQMKNGSLSWDTVRDYISELDKELRADILKVVETKLLENDLITPQAALSVLFPYLTEYNDYLREKAEYLAKKALDAEYGGQAERFDEGELPINAEADSPFGVKRLMGIPELLKAALKGRDGSLRTAKIVRGICRILGLSNEDGSAVYRTALAHDVGYLLLDKNRLQRVLAKSKLSEEDFRFIQTHARKGVDWFAGSKLPKAFKDVILCHHERNDGSGYPKGLSGSQIPLFAKIVGVAETFTALTSERPYRERFSPESALAIIKDAARIKFDRDHVAALTEFILKTKAGKRG
jgi:HD-GYP domain-containing protein (c-di-GMP phosphodiesterase class II)